MIPHGSFAKLIRRRYPDHHATLLEDIERRYRALEPDIAFARASSNPMDRRLDFCAAFLATIQALEAHGQDYAAIRDTCLAIVLDHVSPKNAVHGWLKSLPGKLLRTPLTKWAAAYMQKKTGAKGHADGFLVQITTDRAATHGLGYGFDILECGVVKLFAKHGAAHYAPILCEVDEVTSALAGLELLRGGTIANGAPRCDFRFRLR